MLLALVSLAPGLAASAPNAGIHAESSLSTPATLVAEVAAASGLRLSEILFYPVEGEPGFVELLDMAPSTQRWIG